MEIEQWFEVFWQLYPSDLTHNKKGPKSRALKYMKKLNPDEDMRQEILNKLRVLIRRARMEKSAGRDPDRWPFCSTWISEERFNDIENIESFTEIKNKRVCATDGCNNPVEWKNICGSCYEKTAESHKSHMQYLYKNLVNEGLGKDKFATKAEWIDACKARAIPRMARFVKRGSLGSIG